MEKKGKGLLALVGLAAGAYAFWKYSNLTPDEKKELKNKVSDAGKKVKETVGELESNISDKYDSLKSKAKQGYKDVAEEYKDASY